MTVQEFIQEVGDKKIFTVEFIKKDGSVRVMNARLGVKKGVKGVGMAYEPTKRNLLPVFDMQKGAFRMVNISTLLRIAYDGKEVQLSE